MPDEVRPVGGRFSHVYLKRGEPTRDSARLRRRVAAHFFQEVFDTKIVFAAAIHRELGVTVPYASYGYDYGMFFEKAELRDFLDSITVIWSELMASGFRQAAIGWLRFVARAMSEENVGYRLDDEGGVHYFVDQEFEQNRVSAIHALQAPRYSAVRTHFEAAHTALDRASPDGKVAIRDTFEALEILFKLICDTTKVQRLGSGEIAEFLKPIVQRVYTGDPVALNSVNLFVNSFGKWVAAAHFYRHGAKTEEPAPPPLDLAIALISSGATFLRWLVDVDRQVSPPDRQGK